MLRSGDELVCTGEGFFRVRDKAYDRVPFDAIPLVFSTWARLVRLDRNPMPRYVWCEETVLFQPVYFREGEAQWGITSGWSTAPRPRLPLWSFTAWHPTEPFRLEYYLPENPPTPGAVSLFYALACDVRRLSPLEELVWHAKRL